jgi:hypothetical protein
MGWGFSISNFLLICSFNLLLLLLLLALCQNDQFSQTKSSHLVLFVCLFVWEKVFFCLRKLVARVVNCTTVESWISFSCVLIIDGDHSCCCCCTSAELG